ncbi:MAG: hypothetical protein JNL72_13790 [Flavipsychrobacter sp.]|nr:hypothetical protein [Flavipsychrobacter sp.]
MKKLVFVALIAAGGCLSHTTAENYDMIGKVVTEMGTISDSLSYLHHTVSTRFPLGADHIQLKGKDTIYAQGYIESLKKTPDTVYGKMMLRYNVLQERYNTYADIFERIYRQLPPDSATRNQALRDAFQQVQRKR